MNGLKNILINKSNSQGPSQMKKPLPTPTDDLQDFHEAYSKMKKNQYQEFFKYISFVICSPFIVEGFRAFIDFKLNILTALIIGGLLTVFIMRCIYHLKLHKEMGFTIFCFVFMSFIMVVNYSDPVGYFLDARNSFYFGYGICSFERQVLSKIPDMKQRIMFRILIFFSSLIIITPNQISMYIMQSVHAISGIYFDLDDEVKDKKLFKSYFSYKNQLVQFKDLVVKNIPESIFVISHDLKEYLFANNLFLQQFTPDNNSLNVQDLLNKFQVQDNPSTFFSFISNSITNWTQDKISCNLIYPSSENKILEAKAIQITWDDQPAIAIILHDITEQHTILSLKVADAQKDALLATVSHELRTPLNGMLGMIQVLQKRITDKQLLHYVNICKNSGNLLAALVNSILDLNQIRASTIRLYPEKINVKEFLDDLINLFEVQCAQKNITLHLEISSNLSKEIYTDRNRLSQILINLLGNALKFTTHGKISIVARQPKSNFDHVEFSIIDTGIGVREKDKKKLFRIFGRLEQSDTRVNKEGVGLGLTIADNLARLLCENDDLSGITLQSEHGKGSTFTFYIKKQLQETQIIPQQKPSMTLPQLGDSMIFGAHGEVANKVKAHRFPDCKNFQDIRKIDFSRGGPYLNKCATGQALSPEKPLKKKEYSLIIHSSPTKQQENIPYVLIIDDNPLNLIVAEYLVASHGCKVKTALSGKAAIELVLKNDQEKEPIRLILMDLQMPDMDGYQTTKNLRKLMKENKISEIPIVALTANDSQADRDACFKIGMENYLSKPLREAELIAILNTYTFDYQ